MLLRGRHTKHNAAGSLIVYALHHRQHPLSGSKLALEGAKVRQNFDQQTSPHRRELISHIAALLGHAVAHAAALAGTPLLLDETCRLQLTQRILQVGKIVAVEE